MDSLTIQYIIIGAAFAYACYFLYRKFAKNFSSKKDIGKNSGCDSNCGCS